MTDQIDLSKYAVGKKLKCVNDGTGMYVTKGRVYESLGTSGYDRVRIIRDDGEPDDLHCFRFTPAEDSTADDECAVCGAEARDNPGNMRQLSVEHHGRHWRLCVMHWYTSSQSNRDAIYERHIKPKGQQKTDAMATVPCARCGAHTHDEASCPRAAVAEQPKVELRPDPYSAHRFEEQLFRVNMLNSDDIASGRRAALEAKLTAEHTKAADVSGLLHPREWWSLRRGGARRKP